MAYTAEGIMDFQEESRTLRLLKDKFIRFWPDLSYRLVDLDAKYLTGLEKTLVIGSGRMLKIRRQSLINTDIRLFPGVSVVCDAQRLSFAENVFDRIICHQVLEHIPDADEVVSEMFRVLRLRGRVIVTVPFYFPFHASPYDFRRWTIPGIKKTFEMFHEVETGMYIGPVSAILTGFQHFIGLLVPNFYCSYLLRGLIGYVLYPLKFFDLFFSRFPSAINMAASVYFVGEKYMVEK